MAKIRNTRDKIKVQLGQAAGHTNTIESLLLDVGSTILEGVPDDVKWEQMLAQGYPPNYRDKLMAMVEGCDALLTSIVATREGITALLETI